MEGATGMYSSSPPYSSLSDPAMSSPQFSIPISSASQPLNMVMTMSPISQPQVPISMSSFSQLYQPPAQDQISQPFTPPEFHSRTVCSDIQSLCVPPVTLQPASHQQQHYAVSEVVTVTNSGTNSAPNSGKGSENERNGMAEGEEEGGGDESQKKNLSLSSKREHKKRSKNWTREETLKLIEARKRFDPRFAVGGQKTELWDEIADLLRDDLLGRSGQQCRDKWEKLAASFKVKEGKDHPFYEELQPLLSRKERDQEAEQASREENNNGEMILHRREEEAEHESAATARAGRKRRRARHVAVSDPSAVKEIIEMVCQRHQEMVKKFMEEVFKREQVREEAREQREERRRQEDRAQVVAFHNAIVALVQRASGEAPPNLAATTTQGGSAAERSQQKKRSKNWQPNEIKELISLRRAMEDKFSETTRSKGVWDELAKELMSRDIDRSAKQCREKWDKLVAEYKDVVDDKKAANLSTYFADLEPILGPQNVNISQEVTSSQ